MAERDVETLDKFQDFRYEIINRKNPERNFSVPFNEVGKLIIRESGRPSLVLDWPEGPIYVNLAPGEEFTLTGVDHKVRILNVYSWVVGEIIMQLVAQGGELLFSLPGQPFRHYPY